MCCCPSLETISRRESRRASRASVGVTVFRSVSGEQIATTNPNENDLEKGLVDVLGPGTDANNPIPEALRAHLRPSGNNELLQRIRESDDGDVPPPAYEEVVNGR